jgi:HEAT repeat protein
MKRRWLIGLVVVGSILAAGLAILLDPSARVQGWVLGEPFYRGRSAWAWRQELRRGDEVEAAAATDALASGANEALPVCTWLLRHAPEAQVRARAVNALQRMGKAAVPAGPDLVQALSDGDPLVRSAAARVIGDLAPDEPGAVPVLVGLFPDREAIRAVGEFKQTGAPAVPPLIELLGHEDPAVRRQAVRALGRIGTPALEALPRLLELTARDPEPAVREFAAAVLGEFDTLLQSQSRVYPGRAEILPVLVGALRDPEPGVRQEAARSLGRMETRAASALGDLRGLINDPRPDVSRAVKEAMRKIEAKSK